MSVATTRQSTAPKIAQIDPRSLPPSVLWDALKPDATYKDLGNAKATVAGILPGIGAYSAHEGYSETNPVAVRIYGSKKNKEYYVYGLRPARHIYVPSDVESQQSRNNYIKYTEYLTKGASRKLDSIARDAVSQGLLPKDTEYLLTIYYVNGRYTETKEKP